MLIWTDLGQALHSLTGNNATVPQLKPITTFSTTQADFRFFAAFCTSTKTTPLSLFLPQTSLTTAPLREGKKISFHTSTTLQWHEVIEHIYSALAHFWRRGSIIVRGHYFTMPRTRQQAKQRYYTASHVQMELTFYSRVKTVLRGRRLAWLSWGNCSKMLQMMHFS